MKHFPGKAAFSLVEVAFAVGVASFCLITIIALIPAGITANRTSVEQTEATGLMAGVIADLRSAHVPTAANDLNIGPSGTAYGTAAIPSPRYGIPIPRATGSSASPTAAPGYSFFLTEDGSLSGTLNANAVPAQNPQYRVTLNFYPPGTSSTSSTAVGLGPTRVRILITWPALSDSQVSSAPSKFMGSVETVVELNRNWLDH
jgi:hypothetical protein